jgi:hypothetical protein
VVLFNEIFLPLAGASLIALIASLRTGCRIAAAVALAVSLASPFIAYGLTIKLYRGRREKL